MTPFRIYEPFECGKDGYPLVWHKNALPGSALGVKHLVRTAAGDRCERCRHPYVVGESGEWEEVSFWDPGLEPPTSLYAAGIGTAELPDHSVNRTARVLWSNCDERCRHGGPMRAMTTEGWHPFNPTPEACGAAVAALRSDYPENPPVQAAWRILTVHHLNERKHDLRWHNLCALCQRCHLSVQRRVEMAQIYPYEHSDWFKPYAAAFYAYSYLGEELTRAETMERLDDLLALERVS